MSELGARMTAIATALAAQFPARRVRRSFIDFSLHKRADLKAGIYSLISEGESEFTNVNNYEAEDGEQAITIIGQIELDENKNKDQAGEAVEEAEFTMIEEIKAFCRARPPELCLLTLKAWRQSQQLEEPRGWIVASLGYKP